MDKAKRKSSVERLVERLNAEGYSIGERYTFRRIVAGRGQRSAGAWVWNIVSSNGTEYGSPDTVAACLKSKTLALSTHGTVYAE